MVSLSNLRQQFRPDRIGPVPPGFVAPQVFEHRSCDHNSEQIIDVVPTHNIKSHRTLKDVPLPKFMRRGMMLRAVAHAMEDAGHGGFDRPTRQKLDALVAEIVPRQELVGEARKVRPRVIKPGTRLLREWQGIVHEVTVLSDGYLWQGTVHPSLSIIARTITGSRWNGWVFFGLKKQGSARQVRKTDRRAGTSRLEAAVDD